MGGIQYLGGSNGVAGDRLIIRGEIPEARTLPSIDRREWHGSRPGGVSC